MPWVPQVALATGSLVPTLMCRGERAFALTLDPCRLSRWRLEDGILEMTAECLPETGRLSLAPEASQGDLLLFRCIACLEGTGAQAALRGPGCRRAAPWGIAALILGERWAGALSSPGGGSLATPEGILFPRPGRWEFWLGCAPRRPQVGSRLLRALLAAAAGRKVSTWMQRIP